MLRYALMNFVLSRTRRLLTASRSMQLSIKVKFVNPHGKIRPSFLCIYIFLCVLFTVELSNVMFLAICCSSPYDSVIILHFGTNSNFSFSSTHRVFFNRQFVTHTPLTLLRSKMISIKSLHFFSPSEIHQDWVTTLKIQNQQIVFFHRFWVSNRLSLST